MAVPFLAALNCREFNSIYLASPARPPRVTFKPSGAGAPGPAPARPIADPLATDHSHSGPMQRDNDPIDVRPNNTNAIWAAASESRSRLEQGEPTPDRRSARPTSRAGLCLRNEPRGVRVEESKTRPIGLPIMPILFSP